MNRVVIAGMGIISSIGNSITDFEINLFAGKSGEGPLTRMKEFGFDECPLKIAAEVEQPDISDIIERKEIKKIPRFSKYGIAATAQATKDLDFSNFDPYRLAIIVGTGAGGQDEGEKQGKIALSKGINRVRPYTIVQRTPNNLSGKLAQLLQFKGPNYVCSSACSSAAHAIGELFQKVKYGLVDIGLGVGSEAPLTPVSIGGFFSMGALSPNETPYASRPFDKNRNGFVISEGAAALLLTTPEIAEKLNANVYGEIIGYGATNDAYHDTAPHPDGIPQAKAMELAIKEANISLDDVKYINAHGTSTPYNDKTETLAIKKLYESSPSSIPPISSTKSMTGHAIGAASGIEAIACILAMQRNKLPPTINYETPDPDCDLDYVINKSRPLDNVDISLSNSFGFGGPDVCLAFKKC